MLRKQWLLKEVIQRVEVSIAIHIRVGALCFGVSRTPELGGQGGRGKTTSDPITSDPRLFLDPFVTDFFGACGWQIMLSTHFPTL